MKRYLLLACCLMSFSSFAQTTYLADTAFVTDAGHAGAPASCKANGLTYNGINMERPSGTWAADAFNIPSGATWVFDTIIVYGYQYGSGTSSPFTGCNLQIYSGTPGAGGTVVWGDTTTNLLNSTDFTGIYKVDTFASDSGLLSTKRPIMYLKLYLASAPHLTTGTYWLSWSATVTIAASEVSPFKVLPGRVNPSGQMARARIGGTWIDIIDNGHNVGLNKIIKAKAGLAAVATLPNDPNNILAQNVPNPCSSATTISFDLNESGNVKLSVYNVLGQLVAVLADGYACAGHHDVAFNTADLPAGTYYYQLATAAGIASRQMNVIE